MEFVLLLNHSANVENAVPFRLIAAEAYDARVASRERPFGGNFVVEARGAWDVILAAWHRLPDRFTNETLYTHLLRTRGDVEVAHAKPFSSVIHVVVEGLDAGDRYVEIVEMFWSGEESDFERRDFFFAWRGKRLTVRRASSTVNKIAAEFYGYDVSTGRLYGIHAGRGHHYRITTKQTRLDAERHVYRTRPEVVRAWYAAWNRPCPFDAD